MSEQHARDEIVVYSDYVCPFCYLGRQSLETYQASRTDPLEIDWRPFDLRSQQRNPDGSIDHSAETGKDEEYYEQAKQGVRRLQEKYDVEMAQEIASDVDSLPAQVVSYHVKQRRDYETWLAFDRAVFDALWRAGRDIGDEDVLVDVATEVGIDAETVRSALDDDQLRTELHDQFSAAQKQGVTGVPTFAYDGHAARGAVPPEQLERLISGV